MLFRSGGYWDHDRFFYNRSVNNIDNVHITNVYNRTVVNNVTVNRVSYNGGTEGVHARPTAADLAAARGPHVGAAPAQRQPEFSTARPCQCGFESTLPVGLSKQRLSIPTTRPPWPTCSPAVAIPTYSERQAVST